MIITEKAEEALLELQFVNTNLIYAMPCHAAEQKIPVFSHCVTREITIIEDKVVKNR